MGETEIERDRETEIERGNEIFQEKTSESSEASQEERDPFELFSFQHLNH